MWLHEKMSQNVKIVFAFTFDSFVQPNTWIYERFYYNHSPFKHPCLALSYYYLEFSPLWFTVKASFTAVLTLEMLEWTNWVINCFFIVLNCASKRRTSAETEQITVMCCLQTLPLTNSALLAYWPIGSRTTTACTGLSFHPLWLHIDSRWTKLRANDVWVAANHASIFPTRSSPRYQLSVAAVVRATCEISGACVESAFRLEHYVSFRWEHDKSLVIATASFNDDGSDFRS